MKDKIVEWFKPLKSAAKAAHQAVCDKEKGELDPIEEGTNIYNSKIVSFQLAEQKRIEEETRREEEKARKKKEAAQKKAMDKINALAEKCLSDNEQVVELQASLNDPEMSDDERDVIQARISSLIVSIDNTKGQIVEAQEIIEDVTTTPRPLPVQQQIKVKGIGKVKPVLIPDIKNPYVLLAAVANKTVPLSIIKFDRQ